MIMDVVNYFGASNMSLRVEDSLAQIHKNSILFLSCRKGPFTAVTVTEGRCGGAEVRSKVYDKGHPSEHNKLYQRDPN